MVKILLGHNRAAVRNGLKQIIQDHIIDVVIEDASDADSVLERVKNEDFDLIILDIGMPESTSADLVANILAVMPSAKILISSLFNEEVIAKKYMQTGAMGYLSNSSTETEFKNAIENVLDNKKYISPALLENLTRDIRHGRFTRPV